jgi:hypothetical protein
VTQDAANVIIVASVSIGLLVFLGVTGWWWRQRKRFARGADLVLICALRRPAPLGFGWRSGNMKLTADTMLWRTYWSFRATPRLSVPRHDLRFSSWTKAALQSSLAQFGADILHLEDSGGPLELALFPHDAEVFLEWLDVQAERPPRRFGHLALLLLWLGSVAVAVILAAVTGQGLLLPAASIGAAVILAVGSLVASWIRSRRLSTKILKDEFIRDVQEEFGFLPDFGFSDVRVRYLPWSIVVVFGASARLVSLRVDRRRERLMLEIERRGGQPQTLRDLLFDSGHPDPDRVTRYRGVDGPMRAALAANAHALRLWGRPFFDRFSERLNPKLTFPTLVALFGAACFLASLDRYEERFAQGLLLVSSFEPLNERRSAKGARTSRVVVIMGHLR